MKNESEGQVPVDLEPSQKLDELVKDVAACQLSVWRLHRAVRCTAWISGIAAVCVCVCCLILLRGRADADFGPYDDDGSTISLYESEEMVDLQADLNALERDVQAMSSDFTQMVAIGSLMSPVSYE